MPADEIPPPLTLLPVDRSKALDVAPPQRWRLLLPHWLRALIWIDDASRYDAFLSYSWKSDARIAPVVQAAIQKFLCPWYKQRARTVFRDLSCLPASSSLESELFKRLDRSTHLIVLACPDAAKSRGMEMEAAHWFSQRRDGEILIVVTAGACRTWQEIRDHLLPPTLSTNLLSEPLWTPLAQLRDRIEKDPAQLQLREQLVEDLKQVLLRFYPDRDWGYLRGEERAQRRRIIWLLSGIASLLFVLAVTSLLLAAYAQNQRLAAESRALTAQAEQVLARDRPAALGLAIRGWRTAHTTEANVAVARAFPQLINTLQGISANLISWHQRRFALVSSLASRRLAQLFGDA